MLPLPIRTRMRAKANWKDVLSRSARRYCSRKHCICMHDIICVHKLFYCSPIGSSHCAACRSKWCPLHAPWKIKYNNFACKRRYMMPLLSSYTHALFTCMHNVVYTYVWPLCTHMLCTHTVVHTHTRRSRGMSLLSFEEYLVMLEDMKDSQWYSKKEAHVVLWYGMNTMAHVVLCYGIWQTLCKRRHM
jgi:hypothetical protein